MMSLKEFLSEWESDSPYIKVKTSGSTGAPKEMLAEKRRMLNSARRTCDFLGLREGDTALLCMPLDYIAGKMMVVRAIERGLRLITVEPSGHPLYTLTPSLNFAAMVPMQVYNSLQVPEERERLMRIGHLIIGGGGIDETVEQELRTFPNAVWSSYGMTETLSHIALRRISGPEASDWYTPLDAVEVGLSSDGCLIIDAPDVCPGTLTTNDIAEISHSGSGPGSVRFRILGRKDNVICCGGIKIQAEEVERQLRPYMRDAYLIGKRPDAKFGEVAVLLTEGLADEARAICERILDKYFRPKAYLHVDRIPLTETGKPARQAAALLMR